MQSADVTDQYPQALPAFAMTMLRSQSPLSQPLVPRADSNNVFHRLRARSGKSKAGAHKRLAQGEPSPSPSEPSDENMADGGPSDMQLVLAELKSLREDMNSLRAEVTGRVTALEGTVTGLEAKNAALEGRVDTLEADLAALRAQVARQLAKADDIFAKNQAVDHRLEAIEQSMRAPNAMLFKVPEIEGATALDAVNSIFADLASSSNGPGLPPPIAASRVGLLRTERGAKPRPIKMVFSSLDAKHALLKRGKEIRAKGFGVDIDLTPQQRDERNLMNPVFNNLKAQGATPFFKGSRLYFIRNGRPVEAPKPKPPACPPPPSASPPPPPPPPAPAAANASA